MQDPFSQRKSVKERMGPGRAINATGGGGLELNMVARTMEGRLGMFRKGLGSAMNRM